MSLNLVTSGAMYELKSDHFGIEILRTPPPQNYEVTLKSDHFGIEMRMHVD